MNRGVSHSSAVNGRVSLQYCTQLLLRWSPGPLLFSPPEKLNGSIEIFLWARFCCVSRNSVLRIAIWKQKWVRILLAKCHFSSEASSIIQYLSEFQGVMYKRMQEVTHNSCRISHVRMHKIPQKTQCHWVEAPVPATMHICNCSVKPRYDAVTVTHYHTVVRPQLLDQQFQTKSTIYALRTGDMLNRMSEHHKHLKPSWWLYCVKHLLCGE